MDNLPNDPHMLASFINMKLRDFYDSLDMLCDDLDIDCEALKQKLAQAGYEYSAEHKRFY